jgi:hypothetical protein
MNNTMYRAKWLCAAIIGTLAALLPHPPAYAESRQPLLVASEKVILSGAENGAYGSLSVPIDTPPRSIDAVNVFWLSQSLSFRRRVSVEDIQNFSCKYSSKEPTEAVVNQLLKLINDNIRPTNESFTTDDLNLRVAIIMTSGRHRVLSAYFSQYISGDNFKAIINGRAFSVSPDIIPALKVIIVDTRKFVVETSNDIYCR